MIGQTEAAGQIEQAAQTYQWWAQFGLGGLVIGAMFGVLWYIVKMHREERKEWRDDIEKFVARSEESDKQVSRVVEELTKAIQDLRNDLTR
jgi:uncharacterized membrane protein